MMILGVIIAIIATCSAYTLGVMNGYSAGVNETIESVSNNFYRISIKDTEKFDKLIVAAQKILGVNDNANITSGITDTTEREPLP